MKNFFLPICLFIICLLNTNQTYAQQSWVWDAYDVSMDLPDDFKISKNTNNEFEAIGEGMEIYMYIFEEDITLADMKDATIMAANEINLEEWDVVQNINTKSFKGKYVAGYLEGSAVLLCGLINPNNVTNFFVVITFNDDDEVAEEDAMNILYSIQKS